MPRPRYKDLNPRKPVPQWLKYAGLAVLLVASVGLAVYALGR